MTIKKPTKVTPGRERTLLAFEALLHRGPVPSLEEVSNEQDVSYTVASKNMTWLIREGLIGKIAGKARSYFLTEAGKRHLKNLRRRVS